jgi:hypothetical protein
MRLLRSGPMLAAVLMLTLVPFASAQAQRSGPQTITETLVAPSLPPKPPFVGDFTGTFTTLGGDTGSVTGMASFTAAASPRVSVLQTDQTLTGTNGTLRLRCTQIAKSFVDPSAVPSTGTCAVLGGTGQYASLTGSGKLTGSANTTVPPATLVNTLVLP